MQTAERRLALAGAAVVGVAFGMARFTCVLTLPALRHDPSLSATGLSDPLLGLIAGGTFAGFLAGIVGAPLLASRRGPRAPTTVGGVCGALGAVLVTTEKDAMRLPSLKGPSPRAVAVRLVFHDEGSLRRHLAGALRRARAVL